MNLPFVAYKVSDEDWVTISTNGYVVLLFWFAAFLVAWLGLIVGAVASIRYLIG